MELKQVIILIQQHGNAILKPIVKEAIEEYFSNQNQQSSKYEDDQIVGMADALRILCVKDRHSVYTFVEEGLPFISERPYTFKVADLKQFNEARRRSKSSR